MSKPYDATTKDLIESNPSDWPAYLGYPVPAKRVSVIDADLSVVTAEADKVIRVEDAKPWLLHLEFQASRDKNLAFRLLRYNAMLQHRHHCAVASVAFLLRPQADDSKLTGGLTTRTPVGSEWTFGYRVVRVWEQSAESFLRGALSTIPFAPIAEGGKMNLPELIDRMKVRIRRDANREMSRKLWAATYFLMGLRFEQPSIDTVLAGIKDMEESTTYQALLERGEKKGLDYGQLKEARIVLCRLGTKRFGPPPRRTQTAIDRETDLAKLNAIIDRLLDAGSWAELLAAGADS